MVIPVERVEEQRETERSKCDIIAMTSIGLRWERSLFILALAQGYSKQGYRVFILDLDFEIPFLAKTLSLAGADSSKVLYSNEWYTTEEKISTDSILQRLITVGKSSLFPISVMPSSPDAKQLRITQEMDSKAKRKALRRLTKFLKELKNEELFDIILLNTPYLTPHAINGMMASDFNFLMVDHDPFSFSLLKQYVEAVVGIYPQLNVAGLILHRFQFSPDPENDIVTTALIEEELGYPIVTKLPSLRDRLFTNPDKQLWSLEDTHTLSFFESIAQNFSAFVQAPRRVEKKDKLVYFQLLVIYQGGIMLYRHMFKGDDSEEEKDSQLASAALTSIIQGTEMMLSEILQQRESAKLIEMKKAKLIIEQWKNVKGILIVNQYNEESRRRLKAFIRHFVRYYASDLSRFIGDLRPYEKTSILVEEHFVEKVDQQPAEYRKLPLFLIRGIGKSRVQTLFEFGVTSINDLLQYKDLNDLSMKMNVSIEVVENWITQGKELITKDKM